MLADGLVVAIDVGGSALKGALVRADGSVAYADRRATQREEGPDAVIGRISAFALDLAHASTAQHGVPAHAAGIALPGIVDEPTGTAVFSANLEWRNLPLRDMLTARTGLHVVTGHDVRMGGLAELRTGAARGYRHALFVPVGTGIAGAVVVDGRLYAGAHHQAGEIGHVVVEPDGAQCGCGNRGCLETVASAAAIARRYAARSAPPSSPDAAEVVRRAASGDTVAADVVDQGVRALATVLAAYTSVLDPEVVVLGGGLFQAGDALVRPLADALQRRLTFQRMPDLVLAAFGDDAGCRGAGLLAWDETTQ